MMRTRAPILLFVTFSAGCHNCGHHDPIEVGDTDPFSSSDGCGFICTSDSSSSSFTTTPLDDTSAVESSTTAASTTGGGQEDECRMSADCTGGALCVAPFDQTLGPMGKGPYACVSECVPLIDEDLWCADAAACCDPQAVCTDRGYCELPGATGSDSGGSDSGGSGSGGSDSGDTGGSGTGGTTGSTSG